jgi:hypothetical protein
MRFAGRFGCPAHKRVNQGARLRSDRRGHGPFLSMSEVGPFRPFAAAQ